MKKDIPGYENRYQATEDGHIYSFKMKRNLKESMVRGYHSVCLTKNKKRKTYPVYCFIVSF